MMHENNIKKFISIVCHEFKLPVNLIEEQINLLLKDEFTNLNASQKNMLNNLKYNTETLKNLLINLLPLTEMEYSQSFFNMSPCFIEDIIESSMKNFYTLAEDREISLYSNIDEYIKPIVGDKSKLIWVLNNLICNALNSTNAGDSISLHAYQSDCKLYVEVNDTGKGIPEFYIDKIFDEFITVGNGIQSTGAGLGLVVAKEIIEAHNGTIWCESKLDVGSKFIISLPLPESKVSNNEH